MMINVVQVWRRQGQESQERPSNNHATDVESSPDYGCTRRRRNLAYSPQGPKTGWVGIGWELRRGSGLRVVKHETHYAADLKARTFTSLQKKDLRRARGDGTHLKRGYGSLAPSSMAEPAPSPLKPVVHPDAVVTAPVRPTMPSSMAEPTPVAESAPAASLSMVDPMPDTESAAEAPSFLAEPSPSPSPMEPVVRPEDVATTPVLLWRAMMITTAPPSEALGGDVLTRDHSEGRLESEYAFNRSCKNDQTSSSNVEREESTLDRPLALVAHNQSSINLKRQSEKVVANSFLVCAVAQFPRLCGCAIAAAIGSGGGIISIRGWESRATVIQLIAINKLWSRVHVHQFAGLASQSPSVIARH
ncbi:hypothetical protein THAOC_17071 [Thalassiosira oceanica]|uniref:Uncharacterized protein n=1 Tax=Thalassiosira oceanica TaxID=159749 RepID=K0SN02_THAOC|nr:hypothetical protein THAOC_17071 [Thalassiosira oceanica]|eukprot:EJK62321.1 hypothetical protein THAOC_17071 [Thalassiosira oceanica]